MRLSRQQRRYLIASLAGIAMVVAVLLTRKTFGKLDGQAILQDLSDAFFVPGVLIISMGGLMFVAENGVFDMLNFSIRKVITLVRGQKYREEQPKTYYDYVQAQDAKPRTGFGYLLKVGAAFLVLAVIFTLLYATA